MPNALSGTLILMNDDRGLNRLSNLQYYSKAAIINKLYADEHGYDFIFAQPWLSFPKSKSKGAAYHFPSRSFRHPSWTKLLAVYKYMSNAKYSRIVYIDTDCIFKNGKLSIDDYLTNFKLQPSQKSFVFLNDKPWHPEQPCAGFFIIQNSSNNRKAIKKWYVSSNPEHNLKHPWEQDSLKKLFDVNDYTLIDDWMFEEREGQFLRHLAWPEADIREKYFTDYFQKNNISSKKIEQTLAAISSKRYNTLISTIYL